MSLYSENHMERIFTYENTFSFEGEKYYEKYYFLIKNVNYDSENKPLKVKTERILSLETYLKTNDKVTHTVVFTNLFNEQILSAVKQWEITKNNRKA